MTAEQQLEVIERLEKLEKKTQAIVDYLAIANDYTFRCRSCYPKQMDLFAEHIYGERTIECEDCYDRIEKKYKLHKKSLSKFREVTE